MSAELLRRIESLNIGTKAQIDKYASVPLEDCVKPVGSLFQEVYDHCFGENKVTGAMLPWGSMAERFRVRPRELSIWAGINGHGKSLLLNQVMLTLISQGQKCCIASLELHPVETIARMMCQQFGIIREEVGERLLYDFIDVVDGSLWLYSEVGDMTPDRALALCRYAKADLGIDSIVLDSLMKLGTGEGDYAAEKKLVNSLQNIAKQTGLHIHLVCHSRKLKDESQIMGKFDIVGSGMLSNIADNVFTISRNKTKELEAVKPVPSTVVMDKPDTYLRCDKQRHGSGWEGVAGLWFEQSGKFVTRSKVSI